MLDTSQVHIICKIYGYQGWLDEWTNGYNILGELLDDRLSCWLKLIDTLIRCLV